MFVSSCEDLLLVVLQLFSVTVSNTMMKCSKDKGYFDLSNNIVLFDNKINRAEPNRKKSKSVYHILLANFVWPLVKHSFNDLEDAPESLLLNMNLNI